MADDAEKVVARADELIHAAAFDEKAVIGLRPLEGEQRSQRAAAFVSLLDELLVCCRALLPNDRVLTTPLLLEDSAFGGIGVGLLELVIGALASPLGYLVSTVARPRDDRIRVLLDVGTAPRQLGIGLSPLVSEAPIRALALRDCVLRCAGHGNDPHAASQGPQHERSLSQIALRSFAIEPASPSSGSPPRSDATALEVTDEKGHSVEERHVAMRNDGRSYSAPPGRALDRRLPPGAERW